MSQLWDIYNANPVPPEPPDRDVLRFDVASPTSPGTVVGWRFGTLNFDLKRAPGGSDLVVANVDLRNDKIVAEQSYPLDIVGLGKPSIHRISMGPDATAAISNQSVVHFDLNDSANVHGALQTAGFRCATPTQSEFNVAGDRLYVSCYNTNNVAVLDFPPTQVIAELRSAASATTKAGFGTYGLLLDETRGVVYTYEQGDGSLQVYAANPAVGTINAPLHMTPADLGFDITPPNVEAGRFHFNNVANSAFGVDACSTCHFFGHADGVAWDLSDGSGDLPMQPGQPVDFNRLFFRDNKLLKVTMSLRGIEETPPYHWRGDRDDLQAFGDAQVGLLGGRELTQEQLQEIDDFIFSLSYRPNPDQSFDRAYSSQALDGASCFINKPSLSFGTNINGDTVMVPCARCHSMRGFSGTNNEVNNDGGQAMSNNRVFPDDATQLRGLWDKASDQVDNMPGQPEFIAPASGWDFANGGGIDTVSRFVEAAGGNFSQAERDAVKTFFSEFDTGMAPTTAFAWTLDATTAGSPPAEVNDLLLAAEAGHNELIARGWIDLGSGPQGLGMYYVPTAGVPLGGQFVADTSSIASRTFAQLIQMALDGDAVMHLIGTPVGMGYRLGIDREMDFRLDGDEATSCPAPPTSCSSHRIADTDGDLYPDGYEVRLGSNPNDVTDTPSGDTTAPNILAPQIAWVNSSVAKVRWLTDEESISRVRVRNTSNEVISMREEKQLKWQHSLVVRGLTPGQSYTVEVESEDPANAGSAAQPNRQTVTLASSLDSQPRLFQNSMHVEKTRLSVKAMALSGQMTLRATFTLHDDATSQPLANHPVTLSFDWREWIPGGSGAIVANPVTFSAVTDNQGRVSRFLTPTILAGQGGVVEVITTDVTESVAFRMLFQPKSGLHGFGAKMVLP